MVEVAGDPLVARALARRAPRKSCFLGLLDDAKDCAKFYFWLVVFISLLTLLACGLVRLGITFEL